MGGVGSVTHPMSYNVNLVQRHGVETGPLARNVEPVGELTVFADRVPGERTRDRKPQWSK